MTISHLLCDANISIYFQNWAFGYLTLPVQGNGRKAEDSHRAEDFMQKFDDLAEEHGVDPPATVRTGAEDDVERHTDQAGTNPRAGQVFNEPVGDRFEHGCAAS